MRWESNTAFEICLAMLPKPKLEEDEKIVEGVVINLLGKEQHELGRGWARVQKESRCKTYVVEPQERTGWSGRKYTVTGWKLRVATS